MATNGVQQIIAWFKTASQSSLALALALGSTLVLASAFPLARYLPSAVEQGLFLFWGICHASALLLFLLGLVRGSRGGGVAAKASLMTYFGLFGLGAACTIHTLSTAS